MVIIHVDKMLIAKAKKTGIHIKRQAFTVGMVIIAELL